MDNEAVISEYIKLSSMTDVINEYKTPYGKEYLLSDGMGYAVASATLRGYCHLLNKIPYNFKGEVTIPSAFANVRVGRRITEVISEGEKVTKISIAPEKATRYEFSVIDGKKNSVFLEIKKAETLSYRKQNRLFVLEEERLVKRAVEDSSNVRYIVYTNKSALIANGTIELAKSLGIPCFTINDGLMSSLTETRPVPHELALCLMPEYTLANVSLGNASTVLIADNVENPDNMGLIIRTADACGADAVIAVGTSTSVYNKNSVRASRGAMGRFPVFEYEVADFNDLISELRSEGYTIFGSSAKTMLTVHDTTDIKKRVFAVSNETNGITDRMRSVCDEMIRIPMATGQSSFNVAVAAGIILAFALPFKE